MESQIGKYFLLGAKRMPEMVSANCFTNSLPSTFFAELPHLLLTQPAAGKGTDDSCHSNELIA